MKFAIQDVIPVEDFTQIEETFWREIAHVVPGLKRGNPATWRFPRHDAQDPYEFIGFLTTMLIRYTTTQRGAD